MPRLSRHRSLLTLLLSVHGFIVPMMAIAGPDEHIDTGQHSGPVQSAEVLTGIDVLHRDGFEQLAGRNIGLITNQTGIDRTGASTIELLHGAGNVQLVALFSPEHGIRGKLDIPLVDNSEDPATGLKIFSLYAETRQPSVRMLEGIDTLVFDIQDIGTRFYTYISTMGLAMQAAAEQGLRFMVLDRPNPINGIVVSGPVLDKGRQSFVGFHRVAVRHGMTAGELARMFNQELQMNLELEVIRLEGWHRSAFFDETRLPWVNPSPNIRKPLQALLYPGIGLLESSNLSVGRGTDTPFELLGAPWMDGIALADRMNRLGLPEVTFIPVQFTPTASKFAGETCSGVNIRVSDRSIFKSVQAGLEIALQLRAMYPQQWNLEAIDRLLGSAATLQAIRDGWEFSQIETVYQAELDEVIKRRSSVLLYE